ncbi:MAG: hypothetical protein NVSMB51_03440 [Solirubrobacteraceae bacterium]
MFASQPIQAPAIKVMVVGRAGEILSGPRVVRARHRSIRLGRRRCAIAPATALSALEALHSAIGLHDYGHCTSRARDGAGLFVTALAGQANRGRDGWVYKVNGRIPSIGAADPSGSLAANSILTWFYCRADRSQHCQHTLTVTLSSRRARAGDRLRARVSQVDDAGRSAPAQGVLLRLGSGATRSARDGSATLVAPRPPGRYRLTATVSGLVPAIPLVVRVTS